jgi:hypothetical protein
MRTLTRVTRTLLLATIAICGFAANAHAQHLGDVEIALVGNRLMTFDEDGEARVYINEFDNFGGELFTDEPGFESHTGELPGGARIAFNVTQSLWYWDGVALLAPAEDVSIEIALGQQNSLLVNADSGAQAGFTVATTSALGEMHTHLNYTLAPPNAAFGVYGVVLQLTSPEFEASPPFLLAFNHGLTELDQILAGVDSIAEAAQIFGTPAVAGDTNGDGEVNVVDLNNVRNNFGSEGTPILGDTLPFDGEVDVHDLNNVRNHFGTGPTSAVPEPATWILCVLLVAITTGARSVNAWSAQYSRR